MIHVSCPLCGADSERVGFHARSQFCLCGWSRETPTKHPEAPKETIEVSRVYAPYVPVKDPK